MSESTEADVRALLGLIDRMSEESHTHPYDARALAWAFDQLDKWVDQHEATEEDHANAQKWRALLALVRPAASRETSTE